MKVLLHWLDGDRAYIYVVEMSEQEWDEVKLAQEHFLGEYVEMDNMPSNYDQIEQAMATINLAMQKEPSSYDYEWAEEAGVHPSWVGKFRGLEEHNWGPLSVDATLSTGYFS